MIRVLLLTVLVWHNTALISGQAILDSIKANDLLESAVDIFPIQPEESLEIAFQCLDYYEKTCDLETLPYLYDFIAVLYSDLGIYQSSLLYSIKAMELKWYYDIFYPQSALAIEQNYISLILANTEVNGSIRALEEFVKSRTFSQFTVSYKKEVYLSLGALYLLANKTNEVERMVDSCFCYSLTVNTDCNFLHLSQRLSLQHDLYEVYQSYLGVRNGLGINTKYSEIHETLLLELLKEFIKANNKQRVNLMLDEVFSNQNPYTMVSLLRFGLIGLDYSIRFNNQDLEYYSKLTKKFKNSSELNEGGILIGKYYLLQSLVEFRVGDMDKSRLLFDSCMISFIDTTTNTYREGYSTLFEMVPKMIELNLTFNLSEESKELYYNLSFLKNNMFDWQRRYSTLMDKYLNAGRVHDVVEDVLYEVSRLGENHEISDSVLQLCFELVDLSKGAVLSELIAKNILSSRGFRSNTFSVGDIKVDRHYGALAGESIDHSEIGPIYYDSSDLDVSVDRFEDVVRSDRNGEERLNVIGPNIIGTGLFECFVGQHFILNFYRDIRCELSKEIMSIDSFNQLMIDIGGIQGNLKNDIEEMHLHKLYNLLFPPNIDWSEVGHLTIVPDGILHKLSFESLVVGFHEDGRPKYLIEEVPISYSLGMHLAREFEDKSDERLVAFAPSFDDEEMASKRDCSEEVFGSLYCNEEEVALVNEYMGGTSYTSEEATVSNFKATIAEYDIFHLSTHACIDTANYYNSSIVLNDGQVTIADLYETDWYNKTVVLSACNTAGGKLVSGEGVFNFARTLTELGCKEVIVSLWPIDDCSTKDFISKFYEHKSEGLSSAKAMQQARIDYLNEADKLHAQPYFWAPLILISNDINAGVGESVDLLNWIIALGALMFVAGFLLIYRSRKNKATGHVL